MDISKIMKRRICSCLIFFVLLSGFAILLVTLESVDKIFNELLLTSESVADDMLVIMLLSVYSVTFFYLSQLIASIVFKIKNYSDIHVINIVTAICFFVSILPLTVFIFTSKNVSIFILLVYALVVIAVPVFTFIKNRKIKENILIFYFIPVIILGYFGTIDNDNTQPDINTFPVCIEINELFPDAKVAMEIKTEYQDGTLGSLARYKVSLENNKGESYLFDYLQFKSQQKFLLDKVKEKHFPINASKTSKDAVTLYKDNNDGYYIEFEDTMIVLKTNAEIDNDLLFSALE